MKIRRRHVLIYVLLISFASLFVVYQSFDKWARNTSINNSNRHLIENYLTKDEQRFLLDNNIDVNLFINFIKVYNFELENYEYYNIISMYNKNLSNEMIVSKTNELVEHEFTLNYLEDVMKNKIYTINQLLVLANLETNEKNKHLKPEFYPNKPYALANFEYYITDYKPKDLVMINKDLTYKKSRLFLGKDANDQLNLMCNNLEMLNNKTCGSLKVEKAYMSFDYVSNNEKKLADFIRPGQNDFQLGNTIAFYGSDKLINNDIYLWLIDNAHNYGFVLRFPENKEDITRVKSQYGIFRYVGIEQAKEIYNKGYTIEEMRGK